MIPAEDIRDWAGLTVVDPEGGKIGTLEAVYFDTATEQPTFVTVKPGLIGGSKLIMVPLDGAVVAPLDAPGAAPHAIPGSTLLPEE